MNDEELYSLFQKWFTSLEKGRRKILRDDKWMFAFASFRAGYELSQKKSEQELESDDNS